MSQEKEVDAKAEDVDVIPLVKESVEVKETVSSGEDVEVKENVSSSEEVVNDVPGGKKRGPSSPLLLDELVSADGVPAPEQPAPEEGYQYQAISAPAKRRLPRKTKTGKKEEECKQQ